MPAQPLVSVCIPTYKGGAFLAAAIASVLGQTLSDFELIVVDDNSPDDTAAIVAGFQDPRLVYVRNPANLGPEGNWNRCVELARGRYFKLLPHDDVLHAECLARQAEVLESDASATIALVYCARTVLGPGDRVLTRRGHPGMTADGRIERGELIRACVRRGTNVIGEPGAVLCRMELVQRVGGFDGSNPYVIDLDYWFRLLRHGDAYYLAESLASFRVSRQQWSVELGRSQASDFLRFLERVAGALPVRLNGADLAAARVMATSNNLLRRLFYRFFLPR